MAKGPCHRCHRESDSLRYSWLDGARICPGCGVIEKGCPSYQKAHTDGLTAMQQGFEPNAPGMTSADLEYLDSVVRKWTPPLKREEREKLYYEAEDLDD